MQDLAASDILGVGGAAAVAFLGSSAKNTVGFAEEGGGKGCPRGGAKAEGVGSTCAFVDCLGNSVYDRRIEG